MSELSLNICLWGEWGRLQSMSKASNPHDKGKAKCWHSIGLKVPSGEINACRLTCRRYLALCLSLPSPQHTHLPGWHKRGWEMDVVTWLQEARQCCQSAKSLCRPLASCLVRWTLQGCHTPSKHSSIESSGKWLLWSELPSTVKMHPTNT